MDAHPTREELALVGQLTRPVGLRGQMLFRLLPDDPDWLDRLDSSPTYLLRENASPLPVRVSFSGSQGGRLLAAIEGVETPEEARKYTQAWLAIPESERPELDEDSFYPDELVGMQVKDSEGRDAGRVVEILQSQSMDYLSIKGGPQDLLLPPERALIDKIDLEAGIVWLKFRAF